MCLEAAVELLIGHRVWLWRGDFRAVAVKFGHHVFTGQASAAVDFIAAVEALEAGILPCSGGEGGVLRIAASIAEGVPVDLREAVSGVDDVNVVLAARAVLHAAGHREACVTVVGTGR